MSQLAAVRAFECYEEMDRRVEVYRRSRDVLMNTLPKIGVTESLCLRGAFYIYGDVSELTNDSVPFAQRILDETGVAVTPGTDFDTRQGHRWLRLSYCADEEMVKEGRQKTDGLV